MKVKLDFSILDYNGKSLYKVPATNKTISMYRLVMISLNNPAPQETISREDKVKSFELGVKIAASKKEVDLSISDIAYIRNRIDTVIQDPLLHGRGLEYFDSLDKKEKEKKKAK
ncbi:MAG: hypothetical protein ACFFDH_00015 [Promethearchaeota archaeon]